MPAGHPEKNRKWLETQVSAYTIVFPQYQLFAEILEGLLKHAGAKLAPLAIIQSRPKAIASFAGKAWAKRHKYADPVKQLTDLCGARVICRTRSEVEAMSEFIKENLDIDWENSLDCSDRLKPTEFGYRSVHYIVNLRLDKREEYGLEVPEKVMEELSSMTAEVQLRTVVEHAYADFAHDLTYKGAFELPSSWERELASVAAALEEADQTFSRIEERLSLYATNYGAYLAKDELETEIENLEVVLQFDPENADRAARLGKLAHIAGDWDKAEKVLEPFIDEEEPRRSPQPILRELGVTYCRKYPQGSGKYSLGQEYLKIASEPAFQDVDAICSLAGSWKHIDETKVRDLYRRAFETDPYNTYALGSYLEHELQHNPGVLPAARPLLQKAIERCQAHADAQVNLPWAYYDMGKFYLLLDEPFESLAAYSKALSVSTATFMIETSLGSIERLKAVGAQFRGYEWVRRLLILGLATRLPNKEERAEAVRHLATKDADAIRAPALIIAGGTDPRIEEQMRSYSKLLMEALSGFEGTVISGGTTQGISGLVGDATQASPNRFRTIGYLPDLMPKDATKDGDPSRYTEIRHTDGHGFTPLEPLQNWIDLLESGVSPGTVRVLGINGGAIARAEYEIALALGAKVGLIADSGREAGRIGSDKVWSRSQSLLSLPADPAAVQAFAGWRPQETEVGSPDAYDKGAIQERETMAKAIHEEFRRERLAAPLAGDPALEDLESLHPDLQASNRDQALHLGTTLKAIGFTFADAEGASEAAPEFTKEEVEIMARLEHGRWVVERLSTGWRYGEERSPEKRTSPYLVAWSGLPENIKELDRQTVRKIPEFLKKVKKVVKRIS